MKRRTSARSYSQSAWPIKRASQRIGATRKHEPSRKPLVVNQVGMRFPTVNKKTFFFSMLRVFCWHVPFFAESERRNRQTRACFRLGGACFDLRNSTASRRWKHRHREEKKPGLATNRCEKTRSRCLKNEITVEKRKKGTSNTFHGNNNKALWNRSATSYNNKKTKKL